MDVMQTVKSTDGVEIAFWKSGNGPNLVVVHGTSADHTRWRPVLPMLEEHFTVCAMDRRGRGASGDAPGEYVLEREYQDVAAVCDALDGPVHLLGHSYGALCAMEAALRARNLGKLVLYEPPIPVEGTFYAEGLHERLERLLEQDDRDGVLVTFFREVVRMPEHELEALRADASWQARFAAAHTIPREFADGDYVLKPERFQELRTPTLLLTGENSPAFMRDATAAVAAALPDSRVVVMPGQHHVAITMAP
ncbi:MAG: alpha/beta fold hydrolase, partial [Dehalococcoidia bacterium]